MATPYFASAYMRLLYRFLQLTPEQETLFFGDTGVTSEQLLAPGLELPFQDQMQLCRNALALSEPGLGLRIGGQLQLAAHGALGTAMQNAPTLHDALQVFSNFGAIRATFFSIGVTIEGDQGHIRIRFEALEGPLLIFFTESILLVIRHCASLYTGGERLLALELGYPAPDYAAAYTGVFGVTGQFGAADTSVTLAADDLLLATHDPDPVQFGDAVARCRLEQEQLQATDTAAVIGQFLWNNPGKLWRVEELAQSLNTSTRTLLRRLAAEETSYQRVRDAVLQRQATTYLKSLSVAETAASLGFADESSFRRSFKRWFGMPPGDYRRQQRG